jgi:hypothetical protein
MADYYETVQLMFALPDGFEESRNACRRNAFGFGRAAREFVRASRWPVCPAAGAKHHQAHSGGPDADLSEKRSAIQAHAPRIPPSRSERQA